MPMEPVVAEDQQPLNKSLSDKEKDRSKSSKSPERLKMVSPDRESKSVFLPEERTPRLTWQEQLAKRLVIRNEYVRVTLAEFMGTFVLVSLGCGSIAQAVLTEKDGNIVTIMFGWGMAVAMGVYVSGGFSGGHINPAVSLAMALLGRLPWIRLPCYWIGQYLGAMLGAFCVWAVNFDGLYKVDNGTRHSLGDNQFDRLATDGIFGTFPSPRITVEQCMLDQIFATMLLVLIAMAVTDKRNLHPVPTGMMPFTIGMGVVCILCGYVANCGAALNPARDLGPRIFTAMAGWGGGPFRAGGKVYFLVPIFGPHIGAILGALFYNICVGLHLPEPVPVAVVH